MWLRRHLTCWRSTVCYRPIASEVHYYYSVLLFIACVFMFSLYILVSWERDNFLHIFFLSASFKNILMHFVFKMIWLFYWITLDLRGTTGSPAPMASTNKRPVLIDWFLSACCVIHIDFVHLQCQQRDVFGVGLYSLGCSPARNTTEGFVDLLIFSWELLVRKKPSCPLFNTAWSECVCVSLQ